MPSIRITDALLHEGYRLCELPNTDHSEQPYGSLENIHLLFGEQGSCNISALSRDMYDAGSHANSNYPNCQRYPDLPNKQPIPLLTLSLAFNTLFAALAALDPDRTPPPPRRATH
ncbi:hypothetical protein SNOG_01811 [Parastagonospora nodorum SN15]|uniref:Uncharacterized protein n=1 Tax=Phaeosphaeria nodorum (strain SN15 / ATCC MYA-4574 / FGSC 10173) TaxID=321614 RepID=Q0V2F3_PHANO|nr:hypothetical protein SNOG_01811 [Parastagonospora nodorum SN15]EAT91460.1 hypothetical protein SNOG_01811 [Parastagonospora nodorum SN15]